MSHQKIILQEVFVMNARFIGKVLAGVGLLVATAVGEVIIKDKVGETFSEKFGKKDAPEGTPENAEETEKTEEVKEEEKTEEEFKETE